MVQDSAKQVSTQVERAPGSFPPMFTYHWFRAPSESFDPQRTRLSVAPNEVLTLVKALG